MSVYKKLSEWNPKKGDVFKGKSSSRLHMVSDTRAAFESWDGHSKLVDWFGGNYCPVSRAAPSYDVGKWYRWDSEECPVHPKTVVKVVVGYDVPFETLANPKVVFWRNVAAFMVIDEYVEPAAPKEYWISNNDGFAHDSFESVMSDPLTEKYGYTYVREVIG